jgi:prepilin signal peptidase PulO-like enzyme (type II secretory pathway)
MLVAPYLELVLGLAGLIVGPILLFAAPRLVADRLESPPETVGPRILVPLFGGWLAGKRPVRDLVFELALIGVFVGLGARYGANARVPIACLFSALLILIAYIDLEHRLVLNRLSYPGIVVALALSPLWPGLGIVSALLGSVTGLAIFVGLQVIGRGALGTGDTKLATLIGAMRGVPIVLSTLFYGVVLGGLGAAFYLFVLRRGRREYMPYGPYLAAGAIVSFFVLPG